MNSIAQTTGPVKLTADDLAFVLPEDAPLCPKCAKPTSYEMLPDAYGNEAMASVCCGALKPRDEEDFDTLIEPLTREQAMKKIEGLRDEYRALGQRLDEDYRVIFGEDKAAKQRFGYTFGARGNAVSREGAKVAA